MLIRMSDRVRFCDREVVAAGALTSNNRRSPRAPKGLEIAAHAVFQVAWKEHRFSGVIVCVAVCALSIKPSSYVQSCRKNHQRIGIGTSRSQIGMYPVAARS